MTKDVTRYELISSHGFDHPSDEMVKDPAGSWVTYEYCESLKEQIERLTRERDLPRAAIEQLHAAVKAAQELAATRLTVIERLRSTLNRTLPAVEEMIRNAAPRQKDHWHKILVEASTAAEGPAHEPLPSQRCDCWERVSALIVPGPLEGNGWDPTAQRNGIILAANHIAPFNPPAEPGPSRAGVSVKDPAPPQEIILCAAMGPSGFICERPKGHPGRHCDGDNQCWPAQKS